MRHYSRTIFLLILIGALLLPVSLFAKKQKKEINDVGIPVDTIIDEQKNIHIPIDFDKNYPLLADFNARENRLEWFKTANIGVYLNLGLHSFVGYQFEGRFVVNSEWMLHLGQVNPAIYEAKAKELAFPEFDIDKYVEWVLSIGAKYVILNAKHFDGFTMYNSAYTDYDIIDSPENQIGDLYEKLVSKLKGKGVKIGFHYSILDWHHPSQIAYNKEGGRHIVDLDTPITPEGKTEYIQYMKNQLTELMVRYQAEIFCFDGEWVSWWTSKDGWELQEYILTVNPKVIVNSRIGKRTKFDGDFDSFDQTAPINHKKIMRPFEVHFQGDLRYGYDIQERLLSFNIFKRRMHDSISKGGNILFSFSPNTVGDFSKMIFDRSVKIKQWLGENGAKVLEEADVAPRQFWPTGFFGKMARSWRRFYIKDNKLYCVALYNPGSVTVAVPEMHDAIYTKGYFLDRPYEEFKILNQDKVLKERAIFFKEENRDNNKKSKSKAKDKKSKVAGEGLFFDTVKENEIFGYSELEFNKFDFGDVEFSVRRWPYPLNDRANIMVFEFEPISREQVISQYGGKK